MSLSYYYSFSAPANTSSTDLKKFLARVEREAQKMGFDPTIVVDVAFDTPERRQFARRLTTGLRLEDTRLKNITFAPDAAVWEHDVREGTCHVLPTHGVVLVVTDEQRCETIFGFFRYSEAVKDSQGRIVAETNTGGRWQSSDFVDSPDPRFRKLVRLFADAGFVAGENDEFHVAAVTP